MSGKVLHDLNERKDIFSKSCIFRVFEILVRENPRMLYNYRLVNPVRSYIVGVLIIQVFYFVYRGLKINQQFYFLLRGVVFIAMFAYFVLFWPFYIERDLYEHVYVKLMFKNKERKLR